MTSGEISALMPDSIRRDCCLALDTALRTNTHYPECAHPTEHMLVISKIPT